MKTSLINHIDTEKFRLYLQGLFDERKKKNPSYSLRSFARQLDVHAACLSVILRGKRPLTQKLINRFIQNLALSTKELESCLQDKRNTFTQSQNLSLDTFAIVSQWYHDAILDLMKLDNFKSDISWIASVLEISPTQARNAIERLERCEFINTAKSNWELLSPRTDLFVDEITSAGLKKLQQHILEISKEKIENCPIEKRHHSSMTIAINTKDIKKAKNMIRKFREKLCSELEQNNELNDVYQFHTGFFPLTKNHIENN